MWGRKAEGRFTDFHSCPPLDSLKSADGVFCSGATCTLNCKPGKLTKIQQKIISKEWENT